MESWNIAPQDLLPMHLKIRRGLEYSTVGGAVRVALDGSLEPTFVRQWQHRFMLELDGKKPLINVVRDVDAKFPHHFKPEEVWDFLGWLIKNELILDPNPIDNLLIESDSQKSGKGEKSALLSWIRIPLQAVAVVATGLGIMYFTYIATPYVFAYLQIGNYADPIEEIEGSGKIIEETRMPNYVEPEKVVFAGRSIDAPIVIPSLSELETESTMAEETPPSKESDLTETLLDLRQKLVECQIRRDEYYLQNDEDGYRNEVAKISDLAKEIGEISSTFED